MTEILMLAYDYVDEIKASNEYQRLLWLNDNLTKLYQEEIKAFKTIEKAYNEVMEIGIHHPDFKKVSSSFVEVKKNLYEKSEVKEYLALDRKIEVKMNQLLEKISTNISTNIPIKNEFGFFKGGGSCNGC